MTYKNCGFDVQEDSYKELKSVLAGQGIKVQDFFNTAIENYLLKYKDKSLSLDSYINDPEFTPAPTFPFTKGEIDRIAWAKYIDSFPQDAEYLKQLVWDSQTIGSLTQKKIKYNTTSVRIQ